MLDFYRLYKYVYGNLAKPRFSKLDTDEQKRAASIRKELETKKEFEHLIASKQAELYSLLNKTNPYLKTILYGDDESKLEEKSNSESCKLITNTPTDEEIISLFTQHNNHYGYFSDDEQIKKNFIQLFKAAKLTADLFENNNTPDNGVASEHAYKLLVLFVGNNSDPLKTANSLIKKYGAKKPKNNEPYKPIHDLLTHPIPRNTPPIALKKWQELIANNGIPAIEKFQIAPQIEKSIRLEFNNEKCAPENMNEAINASKLVSYEHAGKDIELARLCHKYNVSNENFEKCLAVTPKNSDILPNITIDGAEIGWPGYYLVKLPVEDKKAFFLGYITGCCQHIGGDSEQCVIDGITLATSGFYVLLKLQKNPRPDTISSETKQESDEDLEENSKISTHEAKNEKELLSPFRGDKINYSSYKIVGQGYLWLSENNNLCFDSWENKINTVEPGVTRAFLREFGKRVCESDPKIFRITIGSGGQTPVELHDPETTDRPEIMLEGTQYGDSKNQYLIYYNQINLQEQLNIDSALKEKYNFTQAWKCVTHREWRLLKEILIDKGDFYCEEFGKKELTSLFLFAHFWPVIFVFYENQDLSADKIPILQELENMPEASQALCQIHNNHNEIVTKENFKLVMQGKLYLTDLSETIKILSFYPKLGLNSKLFNLFLKNLLASEMEEEDYKKYIIEINNMTKALLNYFSKHNPSFISHELLEKFIIVPNYITALHLWLCEDQYGYGQLLTPQQKNEGLIIIEENILQKNILYESVLPLENIFSILKYNQPSDIKFTNDLLKSLLDQPDKLPEICSITHKITQHLDALSSKLSDVQLTSLLTYDHETLITLKSSLDYMHFIESMIKSNDFDHLEFIKNGSQTYSSGPFSGSHYTREQKSMIEAINYGVYLHDPAITSKLLSLDNKNILKLQKALKAIFDFICTASKVKKSFKTAILNIENFKLIIKHHEHAENITNTFIHIYQTNSKLIDNRTRELIDENPNLDPSDLIKRITMSSEVSPKPYNPGLFEPSSSKPSTDTLENPSISHKEPNTSTKKHPP